MLRIILFIVFLIYSSNFIYAQGGWTPSPATNSTSTYTTLKVGIGSNTTSPPFNSSLFVRGHIGIGSNNVPARIFGEANGGSIEFKSNGASGGPNDRYLRLGFINNLGDFSPSLSIISNGNVGIQNTNPQTGLEIGSLGSSDFKKIKINGTYNFEQVNLGMTNNGNGLLEFVTHSSVGSSGGVKFYTTDGANLEILTAPAAATAYSLLNYSPKVTFLNNGSVGIGTTNPGSYKLAVEGKIGAREVNVTLASWSDFVFFDSYKLRPLSEVETFIHENKHLPDVPSAAVVEKEGVNLGEMDAILLRKIEELTLYVIEQEKKIKGLQDILDKK